MFIFANIARAVSWKIRKGWNKNIKSNVPRKSKYNEYIFKNVSENIGITINLVVLSNSKRIAPRKWQYVNGSRPDCTWQNRSTRFQSKATSYKNWQLGEEILVYKTKHLWYKLSCTWPVLEIDRPIAIPVHE